MIIIEENRIYALYMRTNKRVRWQYAEYSGRWESVEKAIEVAKERANGKHVQILIEDMRGRNGDIITEIN